LRHLHLAGTVTAFIYRASVMARSRKPTSEEIAEFQRSIGPVRKLRHDKTGPVRRPPPPRPRAPVEPDKHGSFDSLSDSIADASVSADDSLFFARPGLQQRQLQRLKRGQLAAGAELDLHGMTAAVARRALGEFIAHCLDSTSFMARAMAGPPARRY
jgi:DNA-nicking Smr family endonuclease